MFELTEQEKKRYDELTIMAGVGQMNATEGMEWRDLGNKYAVYLKWKVEDDAEKNAARLADEAKAKREAGKAADTERDVGHQLSWLRNALPDLKLPEAELRAEWLKFKAAVGCL